MCRLIWIGHVSFTLILNYGLEGMQSESTWADQRVTAVSAIVIQDNMMLGASITV